MSDYMYGITALLLIILCLLACIVVSSVIGFAYWLAASALCGVVFWLLCRGDR